MSYRWIVGILALAAIAVSLVSGCGGGEDEASADVTKAQFTKEAEAVCAEAKQDWDAAIEAYGKEVAAIGGKGGIEQQRAEERELAETLVADSLVPVLRTEQEALEDLDVPEADDEKVDKMLEGRSEGIEELEDRGVKALLANPFKDFEKETKAYGLNCSLG